MRYIDTGTRNSDEAVGKWFESTFNDTPITALRIQSGYAGSQPLGYIETTLRDLAARNGRTSILIGSNGGETARETVEDILLLTGPPRSNLNLGVVSFTDGLFHPKVYHAVRADNSMTAFVGSANFTHSGISGKNIEAGLILDTRDGDDEKVLNSIADAADRWFTATPPGLHLVHTASDVRDLVRDGVLSTSRPRPQAKKGRGQGSHGPARRLASLLRLPAIQKKLTAHVAPAAASPVTQIQAPQTPAFVDSWSKSLSISDAQRKPDGNQSGVVALTQANRRGQIDQTTYFRNDLFGGAVWQAAPTRTGHTMEMALVEMHTTVLGKYLGLLAFEVTHDPYREAQQNNYTTKLSLRPIRLEFDRVNMARRTIEVGRDAGGQFWLEIT